MINQTTIIIALVLILIIYIWNRIYFWKKRVQIETEEAEEIVTNSFKSMRERFEKQVEMLDNTPGLTQEEKEIRDRLQEALDSSEKAISKEIKDIKKEIK
jgi:C4-dicarboxylate-specific signal transduction histidine kinase